VTPTPTQSAAERAQFVGDHLPPNGLFQDQNWRVATKPFALGNEVARDFETLGRVLLQFYRAINLLYRQSVAGKQSIWVADWLDRGKPQELIDLQRDHAFKNVLPRVIRPDVLLTDSGLSIIELDSVPGGIGLTAWLNQTYSSLGFPVLGNGDGMHQGFSSIFGDAATVHIVVSDEAGNYRPEMVWLTDQLAGRVVPVRKHPTAPRQFKVQSPSFEEFSDGDAVYRFFELFDVPNVHNAKRIFELARSGRISVTPPPKMIFEEKMMFALLWNRNLQSFWRQHLGESFFKRLQSLVPYTWLIDPTPLPPHAALPELGLTDWQQLKTLSQRERDLILKISGFSPEAWGARGVFLGSDLSLADWSAAVDNAIRSADRSPYVLQRYQKPRLVESEYFDFAAQRIIPMPGRVRLCPYYFVAGQGDAARAELGGVLATICPADKKIIHGMRDAILAPCIRA
jgi:hypothetical protein